MYYIYIYVYKDLEKNSISKNFDPSATSYSML